MDKTVMIVDDQLGIRMLLEEIVKNAGYGVSTADNGKQALDMIEKKEPDLLIIDYKLPVIDGLEVIKLLEEREKGIPSIIMSGLAEEIISEKENFAMVKEVLKKPFDLKEAETYIVRLLEGK